MLSEERKTQIVKFINEKHSVSIQELIPIFDVREATIRRDIVELDKRGLIKRVYGGAVAVNSNLVTTDIATNKRREMNSSKKRTIAAYASELIGDKEVVFIDAGTTTEAMIEYLDNKKVKNVTFITNGIIHAKYIAAKGFKVLLPPGEIKMKTESLIGADTCEYIKKFWFSKCFLGTNGIDSNKGLTTPDVNEALIKSIVLEHSRDVYVLADSTKFSSISNVSFAKYNEVKIITDNKVPSEYKELDNVIIVD